jgi:2-methylisocitrate lyase-like PEP mutase family enzyme
MNNNFKHQLNSLISQNELISFIGVYDVFSASIVGKYFQGIFLSGFSFAASFYGLPDIGFISWSDIVAFAQRVKTILPNHYIFVDIDDGYVDTEVACHVVALLESIGITGVIIEDQKRPRRCGHLDGKLLLDIDEYVLKLKKVLASRQDLFVVARTDATEIEEILLRAKMYAEAGADAIQALKQEIDKPIMFNQIAGGKSDSYSLTQLKQAGISLVNYSTPCLFSAQSAIELEMQRLKKEDGLLLNHQVTLQQCNQFLSKNLINRHSAITDNNVS